MNMMDRAPADLSDQMTKRWRLGVIALPLSIVVLGAALPAFVASAVVMTLLVQAVINGILAAGFGFIARQNGLLSFGHAAFFGIACYLVAICVNRGFLSIELAILLAVSLPAVFALLIGLAIVRIPGIAFGMITLAIGQAIYEVVIKWRDLTNGDDGLVVKLPNTAFGVNIATFQKPETMYVISWLTLVVVVVGCWLLSKGHFGRLTIAIRDNEERARFLGYRTILPRAFVFAVSAFVAAVAGVLFTLYNGFVSPETVHWHLSGAVLVMAIIGGTRFVWGPPLGAIVFFFFKDILSSWIDYWPAVVGATLILVTLLLPAGISGALSRVAQRLVAKGSRQ